jgi:TonB-dependent SusC/RagA subfamily outer membrane receptor
MLKGPIAFSIPLPSSNYYCTKTIDQQTYFSLHFQPAYPAEYEVSPKQLAVFWDVSTSSSKRDINKEINFLKQFVSYHNIRELSILPFNHKIQDTAVFAVNNTSNQWQRYLQDLQYAGSTQLGCIDLSAMKADMYMLFTDGNNTYGKGKPKTGVALVYAVHTSNAANLAVLTNIVGSSGGKVIDLNKTTMSSAITINSKAENWLLNITSTSGKTVTEQSLPVKLNGPLLINGTMSTWSDTLLFHYGNNNKVAKVEKFVLNAEKQCPSIAIERISMLNSFDMIIRSYSWENTIDFGLRERIVTPNTAYIVLEKTEDYIKYNIAPPKELQAECERLNYVRKDTRQQRMKIKEADEFDILTNVVNLYNNRIQKWDAKEQLISFNRTVYENDSRIEKVKPDANIAVNNPGPAAGVLVSDGFMGDKNASMEEVVVTGYSRSMKSYMTGSVSTIRTKELQSMSYSSVEQALQGRVAGLEVLNTGAPGSLASVRISGAGSINRNAEPLYIVDGIPVSGNINNIINVNDIESISVLKDINASALYGSRAANGAIVITSKKGKAYYRNPEKYRLKDMADIDYLLEIKEVPYKEKRQAYQRLKQQHEDDPGFYFDMAQHFFESGIKEEAMSILMNAAEASNGSTQVLRAMGYVLESWKEFDEAITVYRQLLDDYPTNLYSHRDLAWAYYQKGNYQEAVNVLYEAIRYNFNNYTWWNASLKALMLSELNGVIALHKDVLNLSAIPTILIKPMPADLRIVLDCNKGSLDGVSIKEPGGAICDYRKPVTKNGGTLNNDQSGYSYNYYGPAEYQVKNASTGKYKVSLNYYDYQSYPGKIPAFVRMVTFRNFGKANQSIKVENVIMDNQYGEVEIGELRW